MADLTHLAGRLAMSGPRDDGAGHDGWGGAPVPAHIRAWHQRCAAEYAGLAAAGEHGAAFSYLHGLRYGPRAAETDPWRLVELVAKRLAAPEAGTEGETGS